MRWPPLLLIAASTILLACLFLEVTTWGPARNVAHNVACSKMGPDFRSASVTEHRGKTSYTDRFCVDPQGRVFWPED